MADKDVVKVGPPTDDREDDGRKHDDGTAGPSTQGGDPDDKGKELDDRAKFLSEHETKSKVVEAPKQEKPSGTRGAHTK